MRALILKNTDWLDKCEFSGMSPRKVEEVAGVHIQYFIALGVPRCLMQPDAKKTTLLHWF